MPVTSRLLIALLSASSITLALGASFALHLERPYWAGIAAMILSQSVTGQSLQKGIWRMVGTVVGVSAGMAGLAYFGEDRLWLLATCCAALVLLAMLMHESKYSYFYYSTALMIVLVLAQSHEEAPFGIAVDRMTENLVGIASYTLCAFCLRPQSASQEIGALPGYGRAVLLELRGGGGLSVLRGTLGTGLRALTLLIALGLIWQVFAPPGSESTMFVEIGSLLILLGFMTKRFAAWELLFSFAAGMAASMFLYCAVLPRLSGFEELGVVIFALCFVMAWLFPLPEQGMARMGALMPVFVLSGLGGEVIGPAAFLGGVVGLMCAALAVTLLFSVVPPVAKS
ncbi:MAG: FUSC family protein [Mailhella sp.]|nr:FUSC family protein [Mailhella sp.]